MLLYGPPGTGKTLMARPCHRVRRQLYFQSAPRSWRCSWRRLARIRCLFAEARKHQPSIIFIDEPDAVGTARPGGAHNREHDQTLNQLLVELMVRRG